MRPEQLRQAVGQMRLPQDARVRILRACREQATADKEGTQMTVKRQARASAKRPFAILLAAALCVGCAVAAVAAGRAGAYRDVVNWFGAITGGRYEQAGEEIDVAAVCTGGELAVQIAFVRPQEIPYRELDTLSIDSYQILDSAGDIVQEGGPTGAAPVKQGRAEIRLPCTSLASGSYTLRIAAFTGGAKADAPLPITGGWSCDFALRA